LFGLASLLAVLLTCPNAIAKDVTLSWDPSPTPTVTGYRAYVSLSSDMQNEIMVLDAGDVLSLMIQELADEETHYFCVKAYDGVNPDSVCSNVVKSEAIDVPPQTLPELDLNIEVDVY